MELGARLQQERLRLGMTQTAFGAAGGVGKVTQIHYEQGARRPDADYLVALIPLGLDVHFVLTGVPAAEAFQGLDKLELAALAAFRALTAREQEVALRVLGALRAPGH